MATRKREESETSRDVGKPRARATGVDPRDEQRARAAKLVDALSAGRKGFPGFEGVRVLKPEDDRRVTCQPSGIDAMDVAMGATGWPEARLCILHGGEGSGKTTIALLSIAECQRNGGTAVYIDAEYKLDFAYAEALGVDVSSLIYVTQPYIEKAFDFVVECMKRARSIDPDGPLMFVWDSLNAMVAHRSYSAAFDKENFSPESAAYSRGFAKFMPELAASRAVFLAVSQVRMKMDGFMAKEKIGVGNAPVFYAAVIAKVKAVRALTERAKVKSSGESTTRTAEQTQVTFVKNQVGVPFRRVILNMEYGRGIDLIASTFLAAEMVGLAVPDRDAAGKKSGSYYTLTIDGEPVRVQGLGGFREAMQELPEALQALRREIRQRSSSAELEVVEDDGDD